MADAPTRDDYVELLRWYADMGIDAVVDATPHDRFAESARVTGDTLRASTVAPETNVAPPSRRPPLPTRGPSRDPAPALIAAPLSAESATRLAREIAADAGSLAELKTKLSQFEGCMLRNTATQLVFGAGPADAAVMVVGEAPNADDDRQGVPFAGPGGQLLDRMLKAIGLERGQVFVSNVVPWRPPSDRAPTPLETAICLPFIKRQIEFVRPRILICFGAPSAQALLDIKDSILRTRGRWYDYPLSGDVVRVIPMLHPNYLLRRPAHKKLAWQDLLELRSALGG